MYDADVVEARNYVMKRLFERCYVVQNVLKILVQKNYVTMLKQSLLSCMTLFFKVNASVNSIWDCHIWYCKVTTMVLQG